MRHGDDNQETVNRGRGRARAVLVALLAVTAGAVAGTVATGADDSGAREQPNNSGVTHVESSTGTLSGALGRSDADTELVGANETDRFGYAVASAGDVNGDGLSDVVVVGAPLRDAAGSDSGAAYLHQGVCPAEEPTTTTTVKPTVKATTTTEKSRRTTTTTTETATTAAKTTKKTEKPREATVTATEATVTTTATTRTTREPTTTATEPPTTEASDQELDPVEVTSGCGADAEGREMYGEFIVTNPNGVPVVAEVVTPDGETSTASIPANATLLVFVGLPDGEHKVRTIHDGNVVGTVTATVDCKREETTTTETATATQTETTT